MCIPVFPFLELLFELNTQASSFHFILIKIILDNDTCYISLVIDWQFFVFVTIMASMQIFAIITNQKHLVAWREMLPNWDKLTAGIRMEGSSNIIPSLLQDADGAWYLWAAKRDRMFSTHTGLLKKIIFDLTGQFVPLMYLQTVTSMFTSISLLFQT